VLGVRIESALVTLSQELHVACHHTQGFLEVMGNDASKELQLGNHPLQLRALAAQCVFHAFVFGNIDARANVTSETAIRSKPRGAGIEYPSIGAIGTSEAVFHAEVLMGLKGRVIRMKAGLQIIWVDTFRPTISLLLLERATGKH